MTSSDDAAGRPGRAAGSDGAGGSTRAGLSRGMKLTLWIVGGIVAAGIVVALVLLLAPPGGPESGSPSTTPTVGPDPDATPVDGSEVQPPDPTATAGAGLPPRQPDEPLVTAPLPESASADGELVDGFPADIMGPTDDSDVLSSSIATEGDTMQVTLVARTDASEEDVTQHFRALWTDLGLSDAGPSGSAALSYGDSLSSLTLAFTPASGTGTVYMVYGVLRAG